MRFELNNTCLKCDLCVSNNKTFIWGEGNLKADIMFINDFPKAPEKRTGEVLFGKRYSLFKSLLFTINIGKHNAYFTNLIKCKTPKNRKPTTFEIRKCYDYLLKEIELVQPKIIVLLGKTVTNEIFPNVDFKSTIGKTIDVGGVSFVIMHDISYMVRNVEQYKEFYELYLHLGIKYKQIHINHHFNF